jgi:integrase
VEKQRSVPYPALLDLSLATACEGKPDGASCFPAGLPEMSIHDLRHTAASLAVSAGANVKAVQKMLGHSSAAMTLDTYADL